MECKVKPTCLVGAELKPQSCQIKPPYMPVAQGMADVVDGFILSNQSASAFYLI
jgi:hypothetical protein